MTTSAIIDWAFASAMGTAGKDMNAFLAARGALRRAQARGRGLADALAQAEGLGLWARTYIIPDLCAILRGRAATAEAEIAKRILIDLVAGEESALRGSLDRAVRVASGASESREVLQSIDRAAKHWLETENPVNFSELLEYSDIEVFIAPALILGLATVIQRDERSGTERGLAEGAQEPLNRILSRALAGNYGRVPFLLAVDLALSKPGANELNAVKDALRSVLQPSSKLREKVLAAPDLLSRLARLRFDSAGKERNPHEKMEELAKELVSLDTYRELFKGALGHPTGLTLWHDALFNLMLDIDPAAAARVLATIWLPRIGDPRHAPPIYVKLSGIPQDLPPLLMLVARRLRPGAPVPEVLADPGADLAKSGLLLSPWLEGKTEKDDDWALLTTTERWRWLCGVALDIRVLETQPSAEALDPFTLHLLASVPLLWRYRGFEGEAAKPRIVDGKPRKAWDENDKTGIGGLGWLARSLSESAIEALSGEGRAELESLIVLLEEACDPAFTFPGIDASSVNAAKATDLRSELATAALRLVEQSMGVGWRGWEFGWPGAAGRVLELHAPFLNVPSDGDQVQARKQLATDDIVHGLIAKYRPGRSTTQRVIDERILDLVMDPGSKNWNVRHRRLLLAPIDDATRWVGPGDKKGAPSQIVKLTRALMRVASAWQDRRLDAEIAAAWREDLRRELGKITDAMAFDQFVRLQLIDMIAAGVFNDDQSDLFAAVTPLVTFGRPLQIRSLIHALVSGPAASDESGQVRIALYHALARFLGDKDQKEIDAFRARTLLLEQLEVACLFASNGKQADAVTLLLHQAREGKDRGADDGPASMPVELLASEGDRLRMLPFSDPWVATGTAEMMAVDPSSGTGRLVQARPPMRVAVNAFARPGSNPKGPHLGVVEGVGAEHMLAVRFTVDKVVTLVDPRAQRARFGDLVVVNQADRSGPPVQRALPPGLVVPLDEASDQPRRVRIEPEIRENQLATLFGRVLNGRPFEWPEGSFNFAWLAQKKPPQYDLRIAEPAGDPRAIPVPLLLDAGDLLGEHFERIAEGQYLTLALNRLPIEDSAGLIDIVLEDRPMRRYQISMDFGMTEACRRALLEEFAKIAGSGRKPIGLLISFRLIQTDLGPQLELAADPADGMIDPAYPGLRLPFDDRNLWWRYRFQMNLGAGRDDDRGHKNSQGMIVLADRLGPSLYAWQMDDEWGFPTQIRIKVGDRRTRSADAFIELISRSWNPWESTISGTIEQSSSLDLPADADRRRIAIRELDGLKAGTALSLTPTDAIRDDGRISCRTAIGLTIPVNAESVSMKVPCDARANWPAGREAVLTYLSWRDKGVRIKVNAAEVPGNAISHGRGRGYFVNVPRELDGVATCQIAWLDANGVDIIERDLTVEPPQKGYLRLSAGSRLDLTIQAGQMVGTISEAALSADAVWQCVTLEAGEEPGGQYVGSLNAGEQTTDVYELGQGSFALRPNSDGEVGAGQALQRFFGLDEDVDYLRAEDRASGLRRITYNSTGRRCAFLVPNGTAAGVTRAPVTNGRVRVTGLQLRRYPTASDEGFILERRFQMLPERENETVASAPSEPDDAESAASSEAVMIGDEITGRFDPNSGRLRLHGGLRRLYPSGIGISPELLHRAPLGPDEAYPGSEALARVLGVDPLRASFVDTDPSDLEELRVRLLAARQDDQSGALDPAEIRLVFVGRKTERDEAGGEEVEHYLFEWGYGLWLALPTAQIRYRDGDIDTAEVLLFFGDTISGAQVMDMEQGPVLVITAITQSRAFDLFTRRREHEVVNILDVTVTNGQVAITSIEGFDPRFWPGRTGPAKADSMVPHAQLDRDGTELLIERQAQAPKASHAILARLDADLFEESWGETLIFRHVRLDLDDKQNGLKPGERTMVVAGKIVATANDYGLEIHDPGLHPDDVARPFRRGAKRSEIILRRNFSLREQALGDIFALDGPAALEGDRLMVWLGERHSLNKGSLERNAAIVRQQLRGGGELLAIFGGTFASADAPPRSRFELQPGVVVGLDAGDLDLQERLLKGDMVRLRLPQAAEGRMIVELALPGDLHFVRNGRPAIILARHTLAYSELIPPYPDGKSRDAALSAFSVGDLPGLTAKAAGTLSQFEAFMSQPHPRTGQLQLNFKDRPEAGISFGFDLPSDLRLGKLRYESARRGRGPTVSAVQSTGERLSTDWYLLSYRDAPAVELEWQMSTATWAFHDKQTVVWERRRDGSINPRPRDVPAVTASDGPLIFGVTGAGAVTLRRPRTQLSSYVIGPTALLAPLNQARGKDGVPAVAAAPYKDGLLVELYPGRLVWLPGGIARRTVSGGTIPLRRLDWQAFGPGDHLLIRATNRQSALTPVEFDLGWSHGPRNAFGPRGAILERDPASDNPARGLAVYGIGAVRIPIPSQDISQLPATAIVGGDETLMPLPPKTAALLNCSILIFETEEGRLGVHGMPEATVTPSPEWAWEKDSFIAPAIKVRKDGPSFIEDRMIERIRLAGGALPLTVEGVQQSSLLVSRRHQVFWPAEGRFALGVPEGEIAGSGRMQVSVGARHLAVPGNLLLPGAPAEILSTALQALVDTKRPIWLRTEGGTLECGHKAARMDVFTVTPLASVGHDALFLGVICEGLVDGRLYWLPADWAAACDLSLPEAQYLFALPPLERLQVALQPNGAISIIHHPRALVELAKLKSGATISVDALDGPALSRPFWNAGHVAEDWMPVAAQSKHTSVLFAAALREGHRSGAFQGEVSVRHDTDRGVKILLTAAGKRLVASDLPRWLLSRETPCWSEGDGFRYLVFPETLSPPAEYVEALISGGPVDHRDLERMRAAYLKAGSVSLLLGVSLASAVGGGGNSAVGRASQISLLRNIFARALRSIPLEHLAMWVLKNPAEVSRLTPLWRDNLAGLLDHGGLSEAREAADRWLDIITLNNVNPDEEALAHAFASTVGVWRRLPLIVSEAKNLPRVISATRPAYLSRNPPDGVLKEVISELKEIGLDLVDEGLDLPLAAPVGFA